MDTVEDKLQRSVVLDYMSQVVPELNLSTIADIKSDTKFAIQVPELKLEGDPQAAQAPGAPVGKPPMATQPSIPPAQQIPLKPEASKPVPMPMSTTAPRPMGLAPQQGTQPSPDAGKIQALEAKCNEIYKILGNYISINDLNNFKNVLLEEVSVKLSDLNNKFDKFQEHITPERAKFETEVVYKNRVFEKVTSVLDQILIPLFDGIVPDYNLLAIQNTKYYNDGAVCNSLVDLSIKIYYQNVAITFNAQVTILNGVIYSPMYLQKCNKLIPLIKEEIYRELAESSGIQNDIMNLDNPRPNIFSITQDEYREKAPGNSKEYLSRSPKTRSELPEDPRQNLDNQQNINVRVNPNNLYQNNPLSIK